MNTLDKCKQIVNLCIPQVIYDINDKTTRENFSNMANTLIGEEIVVCNDILNTTDKIDRGLFLFQVNDILVEISPPEFQILGEYDVKYLNIK